MGMMDTLLKFIHMDASSHSPNNVMMSVYGECIHPHTSTLIDPMIMWFHSPLLLGWKKNVIVILFMDEERASWLSLLWWIGPIP
jgi:hypothetical protein